jgi:ABC-type bacteriocin/lantibiotic exporter with double-glycine peptidase domain
MVVSYFTGKDHFPDEIGDMITSKGWRPCNNGTALEAMVGIPKEFGLQSKIIPNDKNKTIEQLKKGAVVIQLHHHDFFTKGGHYIVVTGVKADGKFIIQDPNPGNYSKTKDGVDPSTVYENTGELTSWAIWK